MKQLKHKKFIGLALIVFLIFLVLGKYTQSTAFTSSSLVYATTVKDKKTGNKVRFEVRKIKGNKYEVTNTDTGETYQADAQASDDHSLSFKLADDKGNSDGTIVITPSLVPGQDATVKMTDSDKYEQLDNGSEVTKVSDTPSSSSSSSPKSVIKDILESSSSASSSEASSSTATESSESSDSSSTSSSSAEADIKTKMDVDGSKETTYSADYSESDIQNIADNFGKWLYQSNYAKDAIVVKGKFDEITEIGSGSPTFLGFKVPKEDSSKAEETVLANLINASGFENLSGVSKGTVDGKEVSNTDFIEHKDSYDTTVLGIDKDKGKVADYQPKTSFRIYTLKDQKHAYYDSLEAEKKALFKDFSSDDTTGAKYNGYSKLYESLVDTDKKSYQIVLGTDGRVYQVTNYWIGKYDKKKVQSYEVAPDDMQEAYQELLKHYSGTGDSSSSTASSQASTETSTASSSDSTSKAEATGMDINAIKGGDYSSLAGTWKNEAGSTMTISKSGDVTYSSNAGKNYIDMKNATIDNGSLTAAITNPEAMASASVPTYFVPAGVTISKTLDKDAVDETDHAKDRIFSSQGINTTESLKKAVYYKVKE